MEMCAGTMRAEEYRRAAEIVQNYRGTTVWPSQAERDAFCKKVMRRIFSR